jgi:8-oxo-dGTP diphosphatase
MVMKEKRGKVWLAVSGVVLAEDGRYLVVKKHYGGLKGKWSFPAGFVEKGETIDEAVIREVWEETGITVQLIGLIGMRSGVIRHDISDNMAIFLLKAHHTTITLQQQELSEAAFLTKEQLQKDSDTSLLVSCFIEQEHQLMKMYHHFDPGEQFGYTSYKIFV